MRDHSRFRAPLMVFGARPQGLYLCVHLPLTYLRHSLSQELLADLPDGVSPPRHIGDKGYIGLGMITPRRKPPRLPLHPNDRAYNKTINQVRYKIERVIANIKTWRVVLHTSYRKDH